MRAHRWPGALVTLTWAEAPESFDIVPEDPATPPPPPSLHTVERPHGRSLWSRAGETDFNTHYTNDPYANAAGVKPRATAHPPPPPRHTSSVWGAELMGLQRTAGVGEEGGARLWKFPAKYGKWAGDAGLNGAAHGTQTARPFGDQREGVRGASITFRLGGFQEDRYNDRQHAQREAYTYLLNSLPCASID